MFSTSESQFLETLSALAYCNPFSTERIHLEQQALREEYQQDFGIAWSRTMDYVESDRPNVNLINEKAKKLALRAHKQISDGENLNEQLQTWYEDLVTYVLYYRYFAGLNPDEDNLKESRITKLWPKFLQDFNEYFELSGRPCLCSQSPEHLFACLYQVKRAFCHIFHHILGDSTPSARLRATVWQSIFTHDMRRFRKTLFALMSDSSTLITGPSGTGKELVARAIGLSQYISFDAEKKKFAGHIQQAFLPLNLSALSPTLIESELFGHRKGSFTGAVADRPGWFEQCPAHGAVFLDEIGELDPLIQVKLLRVVQTRLYSRLGDTEERLFSGKIITATNRDLAEEMRQKRFRMDLYYRLCSDHIETPSLRDQLDDQPSAMEGLVRFLAERIAGSEAESISEQVLLWIDQHLDQDYPWPGNIRELEQCVRSIMIRNQYIPQKADRSQSASHLSELWLKEAFDMKLSADQLLSRYATWVYSHHETYEATSQILMLDRRTVKSKINEEWLKSFQGD